jgi:hypothetical protein
MPQMIGGPHYLSFSPIFAHKDKVGWGNFILPVKLYYFLFYYPFIIALIKQINPPIKAIITPAKSVSVTFLIYPFIPSLFLYFPSPNRTTFVTSV